MPQGSAASKPTIPCPPAAPPEIGDAKAAVEWLRSLGRVVMRSGTDVWTVDGEALSRERLIERARAEAEQPS